MITRFINLSDNKTAKIYADKYTASSIPPDAYALQLKSDSPFNVHKLKEIYPGIYAKEEGRELFIPGTPEALINFSERISQHDLKSGIKTAIKNYLEYGFTNYSFKTKVFNFRKPYIMGILNVTPDSFSDAGKHFKKEDAVPFALQMAEEGADIIDIGGESTRPGSGPVPEDEELERIIPVIEELLKERPELIISVDTTKSRVAEKALEAGASIINDISGLTFDSAILKVVKKFNAGLVLMHIKGTPRDMQVNPHYEDTIAEIFEFLTEQTLKSVSEGVEKIFIDPGIGFGKRLEDNIEILNRLDDFKCIGFPILIGLSRKSFLGKILNLEVNDRDIASAAAEAVAIKNGARIIRTHNVKNGVNICKLMSNFL